MIPASCKRLIEVDFPIAAVSANSAREKAIRHGHPSTLHLWWARRPLAACRSVLLGLLLPDPCHPDCPSDFKAAARALLAKRYGTGAASDEALRELLLKFIGEFANWDYATNALYLEIGRGLVKVAHPYEVPVVVDPFGGGGSIPLEALRLECEAFSSDLNPVACLIQKKLLEDIPRFGNAEFKLQDGEGNNIVVHGLANALRHIGNQVKSEAEKELAQFYPRDQDGSQPIAYIWARTVRCEGIGCGAEIPLVRSFWLCKKASRKRAIRYRIERLLAKEPKVVLEIFEPKSDAEVPGPTVSRANATCLCCNTVLAAQRVRAQLASQNGGANVQFGSSGERTGGALMLAVAMLREGKTGRAYRLPTEPDYCAVRSSQSALSKFPLGSIPDEPTPKGGGRGAGRAFSLRSYGVAKWGDLFTARQNLAGIILARKVQNIGIEPLQRLLALLISKFMELSTANCPWEAVAECPRKIFNMQAIPTRWEFAEGVVTSDSSGGVGVVLENVAATLDAIGSNWRVGQVELASACKSPLPAKSCDVLLTDPPYYDAVPYSDLSDFFFVWLKRLLPNHPLLLDPFDPTNPLTPKGPEIVQDEAKAAGTGVKDKDFFEREMGCAFAQGRTVMRDDGIACVVFAHKSTEGWEALLSGMMRAGWLISASWPITTEQTHRPRARDSAALAASVHLVCRPRRADAGTGDWSEVKAAMEKRIRQWLPTLLKHGVRGADAIFSCLGPALEAYSRYDTVLTAADQAIPLGGDPGASEPERRGFLAYVFETLSKEALQQVLGDAETEGFEEDARMTALFLWTLQATNPTGNDEITPEVGNEDEDEDDESKPIKAKAGLKMPFDTFIRITRPMGIHYPVLERRLIEIEKGVVRMLPVRERSEQLLGEAATRPEIQISLEDVQQLELGLMTKRQEDYALRAKPKRGQKLKASTVQVQEEATFTTLDRIHRAMLLFSLGRSTLLRQVLEKELRQNKRFERLALALNALYPDGSDERRMLEGVQSAMRGIK